MKKSVKFFVGIFLIIIITSSVSIEKKVEQPSICYDACATQVIDAYIKEVKKKWGFQCESTGGSMPFDIESIDVDFITVGKATLEEAREIEVKLIDKFLEIINSNEKIRPYLREYPFPGSRANISISFCNKKYLPQTEGSIYWIFQARNILFYNTYDSQKKEISKLCKEDLEEATKLVHEKLKIL